MGARRGSIVRAPRRRRPRGGREERPRGSLATRRARGRGDGDGKRSIRRVRRGGGNATTTSDGFVVWVETRKNAKNACADAVTARADHDVEVSAVRRILDAAPKWTTAFAKHHTPLKAARVARADATG